MKSFYTRLGDKGDTGILGEERVPKYDLRVEALGVIDEANSVLGWARSQSNVDEIKEIVLTVQQDLYKIMAEVAAAKEIAGQFKYVTEQQVNWLEEKTDQISQSITIPREFIIPGDTQSGAALDMSRTVVRRAERKIVELFHQGDIQNPLILSYFNRLSSLCFVLELYENSWVTKSEHPTLAKGDKQI